ncbi:hypothetical protein OIV83_005183 [Microbotryomycetes sp. JL201]|nr:hypothetical protein OIV83_005183 [Microbotryomycetes sp. JL201]
MYASQAPTAVTAQAVPQWPSQWNTQAQQQQQQTAPLVQPPPLLPAYLPADVGSGGFGVGLPPPQPPHGPHPNAIGDMTAFHQMLAQGVLTPPPHFDAAAVLGAGPPQQQQNSLMPTQAQHFAHQMQMSGQHLQPFQLSPFQGQGQGLPAHPASNWIVGNLQTMPNGMHESAAFQNQIGVQQGTLSPFSGMPPLPVIPPAPPPNPSYANQQHSQAPQQQPQQPQQQQQQQQQQQMPTGAFAAPSGPAQPFVRLPPAALQAHIITLERVTLFQQRINELQHAVLSNSGQSGIASPHMRELELIKNQQQTLINQAHAFVRASGGPERVAAEIRLLQQQQQQQPSFQQQQLGQMPQAPPFPQPQPPMASAAGQSPGMMQLGLQSALPPATSSLPPNLPFSFVSSPTALAFNSAPSNLPGTSNGRPGSSSGSSKTMPSVAHNGPLRSSNAAATNLPQAMKKPPMNRTVSMPAGLKTQVAAAARVQALKSSQPAPAPVIQPPKLSNSTPIIPLTNLPEGPSKGTTALGNTKSTVTPPTNMMTTPEASGSAASSPRSIAPLPRGRDNRPATVILADETPGMPTLAQLQSQLSADNFYSSLRSLFGSTIDVALPSLVSGVHVDLYKLYQTVVLAGKGGEKVTQDKRWADIATLLSLPTTEQAIKELQQLYENKVAPFENMWSRALLSRRQEEERALSRAQNAEVGSAPTVVTNSSASTLSRTQSLPTRRPAVVEPADRPRPAVNGSLHPPEGDRHRKRTKSGEMAFQKQTSPLLTPRNVAGSPLRSGSPLSFTVPALSDETEGKIPESSAPSSSRQRAQTDSVAALSSNAVPTLDRPKIDQMSDPLLPSNYLWDTFDGFGDPTQTTKEAHSANSGGLSNRLGFALEDWNAVGDWSNTIGEEQGDGGDSRGSKVDVTDFDSELARWNAEAGF